MKHEWRKHDKTVYLPKQEPTIINIPPMNYITIEGIGNPNSDEFANCVQALYSLSYPIKMKSKKVNIQSEIQDYTVFPLEGHWSLSDDGISLYSQGLPVTDLKDHLTYKLMIRQPDFITKEFFEEIKKVVSNKTNSSHVSKTKFETIEEGLSCQMLHIGSFDTEPESFKRMEEYCLNNNFERVSKNHKEIYLSDPRKVEEDRLKTTLRFKIEKR